MADRALPDLKSRLLIDTTSLPAANVEAKAFTESLSTGLGGSTKAVQAFEGQLQSSTSRLGQTGAAAQALGGQLEGATGQLKSSTAGLGQADAAAQGLEGQLKSSVVGLGQAGGAAQGLGTQLENTASKSEVLGQKLTGLQAATAATTVAGTETGVAMQNLAATQAKTTEATTATTDAMALSASAVTELAAVDATLGEKKKVTTAAVAEEEGALEKAKVAHEAHTESVIKGIKATGEFGEAGVQASEKMGALAGILGPAGGISVGLAGFVIGAGAAAAVAMSATESYMKFGEEVLNFQRVTGESAQSSSKFIDILNQYGISAEVGDKALAGLAKRVEEVGGKVPTAGKKLAEFGVETAKTATGSVDLMKTLFNVADAYNASNSAAERDAIVFAAFGKAGQALIPVLEQGSAGLRRMTDEAQRVFDQAQLEQVHKYNVEMARAGQEIDKTKDSLGGPIVTALGNVAAGFNDEAAGMRAADAAGMGSTRALNAHGYASLQAAGAGAKLADQSRKNAEAEQEHTAAMKALDDTIRQTELDQAGMYASDQSLISSSISKQRADQSVTNALKTLGDETLKDSTFNDRHAASVHAIEAAQDKLNLMVKAFGPASDQATAAQDALNKQIDAGRLLDQQYGDQAANMARIELDVKDSMVNAANAAVTLAEKQAAAAGSSLSAGEKAQIFRQALADEEKQLAPSSPLRAALDAYIAQLDNIPRSITTTIGVTGSPAAVAAGYVNPGRASGGPVIPGGVYTVGEQGPETLVMGSRGGYVVPNAGDGGTGPRDRRPDVTNDLLAQQNAMLASIDRKLNPAPFSNSAYSPV